MRKLGTGPSKLVTVRLTPGDAAILRVVAERDRMTYSEVIRAALRGESPPVPTTERTFTWDYSRTEVQS